MISQIGRRRHKSSSAYTLVELILLALIIAVLVGIATPQFRKTFLDLELRELSFNISKLVSFAQEKSIIEGISYKLVLDVDAGRYFLMRKDPAERFGRVFSLPHGIKMKTDRREVIFYPDGHSEKAAITLTSRNKTVKINIKGSLGYVEIEKPAGR